MCTCITEVEQKVLSHLQEKNPDKTYSEISTFNGLGFQNKTWAYEKNQVLLMFDMKFESTFTKVNGETSKPKKTTIQISQTYCSFCGKKLTND
ncbi:hypothetical protein HMPREF9714_03320 [Myroides odoratimimus CCUG 12901]|uniref:hypothetical protein n=1 Tax=Myroides odoratimimus TaxID=76832 RepID=UPI0002460F5E|nr:hypothetical protein [Myroides odoratimimus]EHO05382.1 hypothetical protein HMPREF9714_03320 [Myroides odoratimimus CCUG 12901]